MALIQILVGVALLTIGIGSIYGSVELSNWEDEIFQPGINVLENTSMMVGSVVLVIGIGITGYGTYDSVK